MAQVLGLARLCVNQDLVVVFERCPVEKPQAEVGFEGTEAEYSFLAAAVRKRYRIKTLKPTQRIFCCANSSRCSKMSVWSRNG